MSVFRNLFFFALLLPLVSHAQQYTRSEIMHEADSILQYYVGAGIFSHSVSELNTDAIVYYRYRDRKDRVKYHEVPRRANFTKGNFEDVEIWYRVKYPYPKCAICDTIRAETSVVLGRRLQMKRAPDISFIPDYVWERDSCRHTNRHYSPLRKGRQGRH